MRLDTNTYKSGFIMKNTQHQLAMYDKAQQLKDIDKISKEDYYNFAAYNTMRTEVRLIKKHKISAYTGLLKAEDVLNNTDYLPEIYKKYLNAEVFRSGRGLKIEVDADIINRIVAFMNTGQRMTRYKILETLSGSEIMDSISDIGGVNYVIEEVCSRTNIPRYKKARFKKRLKEVLTILNFKENSREQVSKYELYKELETKLTA